MHVNISIAYVKNPVDGILTVGEIDGAALASEEVVRMRGVMGFCGDE